MSVDFSSWPRDQEQSFVVYEQRSVESTRKAISIGSIAAAVWLVLLVGVYFGVAPEHKDITKGMNMDNLTKKSKKSAAAEPAPTPAPAAPAAAPAVPAAPAAPAAAPAAPAADKK